MHPAIIIGTVRSLIVDVAMGQIPRSTERISSNFYNMLNEFQHVLSTKTQFNLRLLLQLRWLLCFYVHLQERSWSSLETSVPRPPDFVVPMHKPSRHLWNLKFFFSRGFEYLLFRMGVSNCSEFPGDIQQSPLHPILHFGNRYAVSNRNDSGSQNR